MDAIGGYFELELPLHEEYHKGAIKLNTGRNCLEYILRCRHYKKVYIPYYTCEVILEPFKKLGIQYQFYQINSDFEIADEISLQKDESLLYTNYFGLKQLYVHKLVGKYNTNLIVDNTQAFFDKPITGIDTFYTCRKFFGVPDGAYLYTDCEEDFEIKQGVSFQRCDSLLKRIDLSAEEGYQDFKIAEEDLSDTEIMYMSKLTDRLMHSIDYKKVANIRRDNYKHLSVHLSKTNLINLGLAEETVPMVYPYMCNRDNLRTELIKKRVFIPTYWANVKEWAPKNSLETTLGRSLLPLPIDHRYGINQMNSILNNIIK